MGSLVNQVGGPDSKTIDHAGLLAAPGQAIDLSRFDPASTTGLKNERDASARLESSVKHLCALQEMLYAGQRYAFLIILQGMDAAGKDGVIRHVMAGVSPQGVDVRAFKEPTAEELSHDYLWRCSKVLPERGRIGIFNRSYYEELTVVRVHESPVERERVPAAPSADLWRDRFQDVVSFERHLIRNGTVIVKLFLHLSRDEQRKRFLERIDAPEKNWKFAAADIHERSFWDAYQHAYEQLLTHTSTDEAPWYVIPADHKWFTRAAVAEILVARLSALRLGFPILTDVQHLQLATARQQLSGS